MIKLPEWAKKNKIDNDHKLTHNNNFSWIEITKKYFNRVWVRVISWKYYPESYFNLYESQGELTLYHYENNILIHSHAVLPNDRSSFDHITKNPHLPIYLILQGQDCEFRTFATKQINMWDRFFLFNQLKDNEFHENDLIQYYRPKRHTEKIDVLIAVRSSDFLKQVYDVLNSFANPIGGVTLWDIEQSFVMKKQASITRTLQEWVVILVPITNNKFTMIVFCQEALLLQRVIYSKNTQEIEKEIKSTLRFLQRQGYKDDQPISIVVAEDTIDIAEFSHDKFEAVAVSKRVFEKESYKPINSFFNFLPKSFKQAYLAYIFPRLAIKFLIPLSTILLLIWSTVQIKSFFQDYELKWVNSNFEEVSKKAKGTFFEQAELGKLFTNYVITADNNPSSIITNLTKILKGKFQVTGITWSQGEKDNEMRLNFASINGKKQDFKKYISQNGEKILGDVKITWDEHENESSLLIKKQPATTKVVDKNDN